MDKLCSSSPQYSFKAYAKLSLRVASFLLYYSRFATLFLPLLIFLIFPSRLLTSLSVLFSLQNLYLRRV